MAKKKLEDMTLEEAWKAVEARAECKSCTKCQAYKWNGNEWDEPDCKIVASHAFIIVRETFNSMESAWKESATDKQEASTEPFYQQTVKFMKDSGYKRCYMCGAELEGGE